MNIAIVLNYNDAVNTINFVENLSIFKCIDKIVVIDNNSNDNSEESLRKLDDNLKVDLLFNDKNTGYGAGNNIGLRYAYEKYKVDNFIVSNPDIIISEENLNVLIEDINLEDVQVVSGVIQDSMGNLAKNFAWKFPTLKNLFMETFFTTTIISKVIGNNRFYDIYDFNKKLNKVDVLSGCFFIIDAKIFREVNFFDEDTFLYGEENLLFKKIHLKSDNIYTDNTVKLTHFGGTSTKKSVSSFMKRQNILINSQKMYMKKWLNTPDWVILCYTVCFNVGTIEKFIISKIRKKF